MLILSKILLLTSISWIVYSVLYKLFSSSKNNESSPSIDYVVMIKNGKQIAAPKISKSFYWGFFHAFLYFLSLPIFAIRYGRKYTLRLFFIEYVFTFLIAIIIEFIFFKAIGFSYVTYIIYFSMVIIFTSSMALSISKNDAKCRIEYLITRGWAVSAEIQATSKKDALKKFRQLSVTSLDVQIIDKAG